MQTVSGSGTNKFLTLQTDYENQFNENSKLEAGARMALRNFENISDQYYYNYETGKYELVPVISSNYKFTDQVYAGYGTYSLKTKNGDTSWALGWKVQTMMARLSAKILHLK